MPSMPFFWRVFIAYRHTDGTSLNGAPLAETHRSGSSKAYSRVDLKQSSRSTEILVRTPFGLVDLATGIFRGNGV